MNRDLDKPWTIPNLFPNWRIAGLLTEGDPVMDTGRSAQQGYVGVMVYSRTRPEDLCTKWDYPQRDGSWTTMTTSITWGTGLDLRKEAGRERARKWLVASGVENVSTMFATFPDVDGVLLPDGTSLESALALGALVVHTADQIDPEWRARYTTEWWKKMREQDVC